MQKSLRVIAALALIGLGVWGWRVWFPSPEQVIRSRLEDVAKTVSFGSGQGMIAQAYSAEKLAGFFTLHAVVHAEVSGYGSHTLHGRADVQQAALAVRHELNGLKVQFLDINVKLGPDQQTASADLTGKAVVPGQRSLFVQEFTVQLKKVDGKWLIDRVETVNTL